MTSDRDSWHRMEEQAATAYREWHIWLIYRLRRLQAERAAPPTPEANTKENKQ